MEKQFFDHPVALTTRRPRKVATVSDAIECLRSAEWPGQGPATAAALKAMRGVRDGFITRAEAREAFEEAALEAHVLDFDKTH